MTTLDRRYRGVGRIHRRLGNVPADFADDLHKLFRKLEAEHKDILIAVRDKRLHPLEVWETFQRRGLNGFPVGVDKVRKADPALKAWLKQAEINAKTRKDYECCTKAVLALARDPSVSDLPILLRRYRDVAPSRMFNLTRAVLRSFATHTDGRYSDLWNALSAVQPKRVTRVAGRTLKPNEARAVAEGMGNLGGMWWSLCTTGMSGGPHGPYFRDRFTVLEDRILIHGTKRAGRERVVPRIATPIRPIVKYAAFRKALPNGVDPNCGRRTYEAWTEAAGIPKWARRRLIGHGPSDVTDAYGDDFGIEDHLAEYREMLLGYIGSQYAVKLGVI